MVVGEPKPFPISLYVICGNHEDHAWLHSCYSRPILQAWQEVGLHYQARASYRIVGEERTSGIGFLGGALNIDEPQVGSRFRGNTNYITHKQAKRAAAKFNTFQPPLIITHSCPSRICIGMRGNPELADLLKSHVIDRGYDPGPHNDAGEHELTWLWQRLNYQPAAWAFGHFHYYHHRKVGGTNFYSTPIIESDDPIMIWDTEACIMTRMAL